jgi:hypothetical protein
MEPYSLKDWMLFAAIGVVLGGILALLLGL